ADGFTLLGIAILTVSEIMLYRYAEIGRDTGAETLVAGYDDNRAVKRTIIGVYVVIIVALCWLALLSSGNSGTFAYFQF
ncbi:MAG: hypothetical protein J6Y89_02415, partial [Lachnospiraceae bacterium]|nr:hypothetical protein [Lachnospiraceae bacterium]